MEITGTTYSVSHYEEFEKTGNKDIFENIIDSMIMDGIAGMNESFRRAISSLPKDKKRLAILSILDKDRNLFAKIKESITDINLSKIDHVKNIILMLREYVKIAEVEKKKFGEVMTPLDLVKEMLNTLPAEVWSNPNLKWLDPANGTGPFPAVVIYKLMKGLESWEPDADKRYKHIIENMIYVCELQPKNMFLYLCTVDPKDELACNIYTGSFLDEGFDYHMKNVWGVEKFDIVIGNPPYQMDSGNRGSGHTLWDKFFLKSVKINQKDGYITMVHPSGWRNISGSFETIKGEIYKRNLLYLEIHNINDGIKVFGAATRYDFYCLKNSDDYKYTIIVDEDGVKNNINIHRLKFIPNKYFNEFIKYTSHDDKLVELIYNRSMYGADKKHISKDFDEIHKYPCVKYISKVNNQIDFRYSSEKKGMFGIPKVMFGIGAQVGGISIDENGDYGLCQFVAGIADDKKNLENIQKALKSEKFKNLMKACQFTTQMYNHKIIQQFRKDFWKEFINI